MSKAKLAFAIGCLAAGVVVADRYVPRLAHPPGYFLVAVEDRPTASPPPRPRRTAFVVVDGLRRDFAERMDVTRELAAAGQCRVSDQGSLTVSRPVYTVLSAGLEADRTGVRNNDMTEPTAVESIWEVAREAGLTVAGSSHLAWWQELFPRGFDRYEILPTHAQDVFRLSPLRDVNLFHPLYVDDAGHREGAASKPYAEAAARADREIRSLLERFDLRTDLVVLTADHGHRDAGGHGGQQPEIEQVLTCFAGFGVARREGRAPMDGRSTAAALAVLLGVRFPRHMRAGDDDLDVVFEIAEPRPENAAWLDDRRHAIARFREENRRAIPTGSWPSWEAHEATRQRGRGGAFFAVAALAVAVALRRRRVPLRTIAFETGWLAFAALATWAAHRAILGAFDFSVINLKERYVPRAFLVALAGLVVALAVRRALRRELATGALLATAGLLLLDTAHVVAYGWPLGYPLPGAAARYFPFIGGIALATSGLLAGTLVLRARRSDPRQN